jgi:uncharacterized protein
MEKVLISGGTGIIGLPLCKMLIDKGYNIAILSRETKSEKNIKTYYWNIDKHEIDKEAVETADYIIHLAGANIGEKRWTKERKQLIIDSRIKSSELIFNKLKEINCRPKAFISASAIGYYGSITSDKIFSESDPPSNDFLGKTCKQWEESADRFNELGVRIVKIRTGVVLTKQSGVLEKLAKPVNFGLGAALGNGKQYIPWIHIEDLCGIYLKAIEDNQMKGPYNAVARDHKTNTDFMRIIAQILKRPYWLPNIPASILKIYYGEMSDIILKGSRVSSDKLITAGYKFQYPNLEKALIDLLQ